MRVSTIFKLVLLLSLVNFILGKPLNTKWKGTRKDNKKQKGEEPVLPTTTTAPSIDVILPLEDVYGNDENQRLKPTTRMTYHQKMIKARNYMRKYGYMQMLDSDPQDLISIEEKDTEGIKMMQMYMGVDPTGQLDRKTMEMLDRPRCGVPDIMVINGTQTGTRQRRYFHYNLRWDENELTFRIRNYPYEMTRDEVRSSIYKAFQVWSNVTPLRFYEVEEGSAHINMDFGTYNHGDSYPFDGPGYTLAHAFPPKSGWGELEGDIHFDDSEYFTFEGGQYNTVNLFIVAAHEIGHALGLHHSQDSSALMAPFYRYVDNFELPYDDLLGITSLYGYGNGDVVPLPSDPIEPVGPVVPPTTNCHQEYDAVAYYRGELYMFKGDKYWRLRNDELLTIMEGDRASTFFQDFPGDIDGAYESYQQNRFFVFKGKYYYVYNGLTIESGPTPIRYLDPNLPTDIDGVLSWQKYGETYFFKGSQVWTFDERTRKVNSAKSPRAISEEWPGIPNDVTAAFHDGINSYTYFLRGSNYFRFDDVDGAVDNGYPRQFGWDFLGCS